MISFDNSFKLSSEWLGIEKQGEEKISLVSHAHSDHIPSGLKSSRIMASSITKRVIQLKKNKERLLNFSNGKIKMLNAGHILGSRMFLINNTVLYTGDFNPQGEFCGKARPVKCRTLIMETMFGRPRFVFPKKSEVIKELVDYIKENKKVLITASDVGFGKPQEICSALDKNEITFNVNDRVLAYNDYLKLKFNNFDPQSEEVIVTDKFTEKVYPSAYKRVHLSGWCSSKSPFAMNGISKGFPYSSHSDYPSLIEFVKKCRPEKVYTLHGYASEFAYDLRKQGFDAQPLSALTGKKKKGKEYQATIF